MTTMLAETVQTNNFTLDCAAITGILVVAFNGLRGWWSDKQSIQALRDIADSNAGIREGQIAQNGKLSKVAEINEIYHKELLRCIDKIPCTQVDCPPLKSTTKTIEP